MTAGSHPPIETRRSWFQGGCAAVFAGVLFYSWAKTGYWPDFFGALAFVAFAVAWYGVPVSFTQPLRAQLEERVARARAVPRWALMANAVALVFLTISLGLRLVYWLAA